MPRLRRRLGQLGVHPVGQRGAGGDQQARGQRVVLGLGDQVGGDEAGLGAVVGDDGDLGRTRLGVDGDAVAQQPLGRRDVDVAGPGDDVDRRALVGAVAEHGDGLRAAGRVHLGDAEQRARGQDRRVRQAAVLGLRWRGDGDLGDAGHLGRDHVHQHRRGVGDQPARYVDAGPADRQVPLGDRRPGRHGGPGLGRQLGLVHEPGAPCRLGERRPDARVQRCERRG